MAPGTESPTQTAVFKEECFVIIIKHSSTGRERCCHTRLVAALLPSIQTQAQEETQAEEGSACS